MTSDDAITYDASDQASVDNQAKDAKRREAEDLETIRVWMNHPKGRDLLYRLAYEVCHLNGEYLGYDDHGRSDPLKTYVHLGERNIGGWIDERMRSHPDLYMKMLQEQQVEREMRATRLRKQNESAFDDGDHAG